MAVVGEVVCIREAQWYGRRGPTIAIRYVIIL